MKAVLRSSNDAPVWKDDPLLTYLPNDSTAFERAKGETVKRSFERKQLAHILSEGQTQDEITNCHLKKIEEPNSCFVVTGQQLGLMGGPLYTILKGISAVLLAKKYDAIPLFWLATEDHDIGEINHTYRINDRGDIQKYRLPFALDSRQVEDLSLTEDSVEVIRTFVHDVGYHFDVHPGESYVSAMRRLMQNIFSGTGLLFIEPKQLRPLSIEIYQKEVRERSAIRKLLSEPFGDEAIIKFQGDTNLFVKNADGQRLKLQIEDEESICEDIALHPEKYSSNVALRTIIQNALLPTAAYVGGVTEIAYHRQLRAYHHFHGIEMPWITPRISATLIDERAADILKRNHTNPWEDTAALEGQDKHYLHNLLHPKAKKQERVLNFLSFGSSVKEMIEELNPEAQGHYYIWA